MKAYQFWINLLIRAAVFTTRWLFTIGLFLLKRPRLALLLVAGIIVLELAANVRGFWLLLIGFGLLAWGARLRVQRH